MKSLLQKAISPLPGCEGINHWLQRHVTKGYPFKEDVFRGYLAVAREHLSTYDRCLRSVGAQDRRCLEFGSGWDLQMALFFYAAGLPRQVCVDLRPLLRLDLVNHNLERLKKNQAAYEALLGRRFHPLPERPVQSLQDLRDVLNIDYRAPVDMRSTDFPSGHFDFISSSKVFEHVPEVQIPPILQECHRILREDGVMGIDIDMQDHLQRVDPRITSYNFLTYSDATWEHLQSRLNYQNRLRLPDYVRFLEKAGFEVVRRVVTEGSTQDVEDLKRLKLADRFRGPYTWEELAARVVHIAVRKSL